MFTSVITYRGWAIVDTHDNLVIADDETPYLFTSREQARSFIRVCINLSGYKAVPVILRNNPVAGAQQRG